MCHHITVGVKEWIFACASAKGVMAYDSGSLPFLHILPFIKQNHQINEVHLSKLPL